MSTDKKQLKPSTYISMAVKEDIEMGDDLFRVYLC
jgi:hypothetical protein